MDTALYSNVPKEDYMGLYKGKQLNYKKTVGVLNLDPKTVAIASGVAPSSVRYDKNMPKILKERITQWALAITLVAKHFEGDADKTALWFNTINPMLGDRSPVEMIKLGLFPRLLHFIIASTSPSSET